MTEKDVCIRQAKGMLQSAVDGDVVAMSIDRGMCYSFNGMGSHIWRLLEDWTNTDTICSALMREYEVDQDSCQAEVRRLINELAAEGLIEIQEH